MKKLEKALGLFDKLGTGSIKEKAADYSIMETIGLVENKSVQYGINMIIAGVKEELGKKFPDKNFLEDKSIIAIVDRHLYQRIGTAISDCYDLVKKVAKKSSTEE